MAQSLPEFLDLVKRSKPEEIVTISREIDPAYELTALVVKLEREARRRPVLICERMRGTKFPVLTNLHASRSRLALAMGAAPADMLPTYLRAMDTPIPPRLVASGPCKDVILTGERVNLYDLPQILHHEGDGGGEVRARVPFVVEDLRQIVKINPLAGEDHVLAGPALHEARGDRLVHGAEIRRQHVGRRGAHGEGEARSARVEIGQHGEFRAAHPLADHHGTPARFALELDHEGGELVGRIDLSRDRHDLLGLGPLHLVEELREALGHCGDSFSSSVGARDSPPAPATAGARWWRRRAGRT